MNPRVQFGCILVGVALGAAGFHWAANVAKDIDPDNVGLGRNTVASHSKHDGKKVSAGDPMVLIPSIQQAKREGLEVVLWLGASQLHAINRFSDGDDLAVGHANRGDTKRRFVQCSMGNANFHELLCMYLRLRDAGLKPDILLVALTYDDLREEGIRPSVREWIQNSANLTGILDVRVKGNLEKELQRANSNDPNPMQRNSTAGSPQEQLEARVVNGLEHAWPSYQQRGAVHSMLRILLRSGIARVLGGMFKRRTPEVPVSHQHWNHDALVALANLARRDGVRVCLYQQPHRPGQTPFLHNRDRYDAWHASIRDWVKATPGLFYTELETIVPDHLWGLTNEGRPDCFHFQDEGHRILGDAVKSWLDSLPEGHAVQ